jgi:uncharacterized membrane protein YjjP (DUF1212 family)
MSAPTELEECESLEGIAPLALDFGRLLMESGATAQQADEITTQVAAGLGADRVEVRVGYASVAITIDCGNTSVSCMRKVGHLGVNQSLYFALRTAALAIGRGGVTIAEAGAELNRLVRTTPRHPDWMVALGVGVACAAFGRLLDVDWPGVVSIFAATAIAQIVRRQLAVRNVNVFLAASVIAFLASTLCGIGARWAGSGTIGKDMIATVLLLVPGVAAFNAQVDILDGRPTLGSARAVWVAVMLVFMSVGIWLALDLLGELHWA